MSNTTKVPTKDFQYKPGMYIFGISYEQDMAFSTRLYGKTKQRFIAAVNKAWGISS